MENVACPHCGTVHEVDAERKGAIVCNGCLRPFSPREVTGRISRPGPTTAAAEQVGATAEAAPSPPMPIEPMPTAPPAQVVEWLQTVRSGVLLEILAWCFIPLIAGLALVLGRAGMPGLLLVATLLVVLARTVASVSGDWCVSTEEPSTGAAPEQFVRVMIRLGAVAGIVQMVLSLGRFLGPIGFLAGILATIGGVCFFRYLAVLSRRMGNRRLSRRFLFLTVLLLAVLLVVLLAGVGALYFRPDHHRPAVLTWYLDPTWGVVTIAAGGLIVAYVGWCYWSMARLLRAKAAEIAAMEAADESPTDGPGRQA